MTMPSLPEPYTEQVEEYSGIAMNKVVRTPLFNADQMRAYGDARAAAALEQCAEPLLPDEIRIIKDASRDFNYVSFAWKIQRAAAIRGCDFGINRKD